VTLAFYSIAVFGFVYVVGHGVITLSIREGIADADSRVGDAFLALIECPACFSWWVGLVAGALGTFQPTAPPIPWYGWAFILAFYSAGSSYILARLTGITPKPGDPS
jgi:hypothetical protein